MESSIAEFLKREHACELLPTDMKLPFATLDGYARTHHTCMHTFQIEAHMTTSWLHAHIPNTHWRPSDVKVLSFAGTTCVIPSRPFGYDQV